MTMKPSSCCWGGHSWTGSHELPKGSPVFGLPCSDADESDDDVLSVGLMRPLLTAAPLGGAWNATGQLAK